MFRYDYVIAGLVFGDIVFKVALDFYKFFFIGFSANPRHTSGERLSTAERESSFRFSPTYFLSSNTSFIAFNLLLIFPLQNYINMRCMVLALLTL